MLSRYVRKTHRLLVVPVVVVMLLARARAGTDLGLLASQAESILLPFTVATGIYLFLRPYVAKRRAEQKGKSLS